MRKLSPFIFVIVTILGCDHGEARQHYQPRTTESFPTEKAKTYCSQTSGSKFYDNLKICTCRDYQKYFVIKNGKGKCISPIAFDWEEENGDFQTPTGTAVSNFVFDLLGEFFASREDLNNQGSETGPDESTTLYEKNFAGTNSTLGITSKTRIPNIKPAIATSLTEYFKDLSYSVFIKGNNQTKETFIKNLFSSEEPRLEDGYMESFIFKNSHNYARSFKGGKLQKIDISKIENNSVKIMADAYNQLLSQELTIKSYGNCAHFCYIDGSYELPRQPGTIIKVTGYRSLGSAIRTRIQWLNAKTNDTFAVAQLTPAGRIATITTIENKEARAKVTNMYTVYEYPFSEASLIHQDLLIDKDRAHRLVWEKTQKYSPENTHILVCDIGDLSNSISTDVMFTRGPDSSSLLGWVSSGDQALYYKYDGVSSTDHNRRHRFGSDHLYQMSKAITKTYNSLSYSQNQVGIIPISYAICSRHYDKIASNLKTTNVRVVNVSMVGLYHPDQCQESQVVKTINSTKKDLLWVMAAGNGKNEMNPRSKYCPQQATSSMNTIIASQQGLTAGARYSDIYSDHDIGGSGSSNSTATISALAANIVNRYPELSITQIRMAILASGDFNLRHMVRTSSIINRSRALRAARILSKFPKNRSVDVDLDQLLSHLFSQREAEKRYFLYQSRGVFPNYTNFIK